MERVFLLISRDFYVRNGILRQTGDCCLVFADVLDARYVRDRRRAIEASLQNVDEQYDAILDKFIITRPNGSKIELEIAEAKVR